MLPFTIGQFLDVFAAYNAAIWPLQIVAYVLGLFVVALVLTGSTRGNPVVEVVLGFLWLVNGLAYHLQFFSQINVLAYGFAALFAAQAVLFALFAEIGRTRPMRFRWDARGILGLSLVAYAMVFYSAIGYALGQRWPHVPVFGVAPCPTAIFTFGILLLLRRRIPLWLLVIPFAWAAVGTSAALLLSIHQDLALLAAAAVAATFLLGQRTSNSAAPPAPAKHQGAVDTEHSQAAASVYAAGTRAE